MCYVRAVDRGDKESVFAILRNLSDAIIAPTPSPSIPDSEFEIQVANFLRNEGFHVDYQVGESGFRIDLGIKQTQQDELYLCGLECDGRKYHSSWSARMNDIWRQEILESKGWKILRIWSTEWFGHQEKAKQKLLKELNNIPSCVVINPIVEVESRRNPSPDL